MRGQVGLLCGCIGTALWALGTVVMGADDPTRREPSEVVLRSLTAKLQANDRVVDTRGRFLRYRVEQVKGEWLWLVADCGTRAGPTAVMSCRPTRRLPTSAN